MLEWRSFPPEGPKQGDIDTFYFLSSNIEIPHFVLKWRVAGPRGGQVCGYPWQAPAFLPLLPGPKLVTQSHHSLLRMEPRVGPAPLPLPQPLPQISPRHHNNPDLIQVKEFSFSLFHNDSWVLSSWNEKWECPWRDTPRFKTRHYWELETEEQRISVCSVVFIGNFSRIYWF